MTEEYFSRLKRIDAFKQEDHSTLPACTMQEINIYGENHKAAAVWLKSALADCSTKGQEILIRTECEKLFNVIISSQ